MNFLPATVEGDQITLPFGTFSLPADKAKRAADKGLLMAGIRPEHFEDVSVIDPDSVDTAQTFQAHIDVREWLGDQQYAYVPYEAEAKVQDQLRGARPRGRQRLAAHPARRLARRGQPDPRGRRRRPCPSTPPRCTCSIPPQERT